MAATREIVPAGIVPAGIVPTGIVPTLSQVLRWDTGHLIEAAEHWTRSATVWEGRFTELVALVGQPGGTRWEGEAAEAVQQRTHADRMAVIALADQLHRASGIARAGAAGIDEARRRLLRVVESAQTAGFVVGEDFSLTDSRRGAATAATRRAQAQALAVDLRTTIGALLAADAGTAGQLTAATAGLGTAVLPEGAGRADDETRSGTIQPVDFVKRDGGPDPVPAPAEPGGMPFTQCVEKEFNSNVGFNVVKDGMKSALAGAAVGVAGGGAVLPKGFEPIGALGGGVIGFVGGFTRGIAKAPLTTLVEAGVECSDIIEKVRP